MEDNKLIQENHQVKMKLSVQDQMQEIVMNFAHFNVNA